MSDHEFEKQVRQKLDDLRLTPSLNAWENIEHGLREGKRRRMPFFWIPLLLIGLAAGGYFIVKRETAVGNGQRESVKRETAGGNGQRESVKRETAVGNGQRESVKRETAEANRKSFIAKIDKDVVKEFPIKYYSKFPHITSSNLTKPLSFALPVDHELPTAPLTAKISDPVSKSKKWSLGVGAFSGLSTVNKGNFFEFSKPQIEDVTLRAAFPAQAFAPAFTPTSIYPGLSFSIGATARRTLSKRFLLSAGINYLQMNTHNREGKPVYGNYQLAGNSISTYPFVFNYFRVEPERPKDYNNRYHFIEVPVTLHTKLNHSQKLPVYWNAGVSVSQLIASHSLHFDETRGGYYKNNSLLNQRQFAVATGFSFSILNKKEFPLWIGPSAKYNLSKILKKNMSSRNNFMSLGLDFKLFIR